MKVKIFFGSIALFTGASALLSTQTGIGLGAACGLGAFVGLIVGGGLVAQR